MAKIIHYEDLWLMAEKVAAADPISGQEVVGKISATLQEIRDVYRVAEGSKDKQLVKEIKSKAIGRLLMNIAHLSQKEDVDVYSALKDQLDVLKVKTSLAQTFESSLED